MGRPDPGSRGQRRQLKHWDVSTFVPHSPGLGDSALVSFTAAGDHRLGGHIFGRYPFSAAGGIVDDVEILFALENQTRPIYSAIFFGGPTGDFVVVHELAHQWYGDSLAVEPGNTSGSTRDSRPMPSGCGASEKALARPRRTSTRWRRFPRTTRSGNWRSVIQARPAVRLRRLWTWRDDLARLRLEVGDEDFFRILRQWATTSRGQRDDGAVHPAGGTNSGEELDALFDAWLTSGKPDVGTALRQSAATRLSINNAPAAVRSLAERLHDHRGMPFVDVKAR